MIPPFLLRNIATVNFYLYGQDFPIGGRGNTVFLGGNGSGKSVLLDAIQIVMTGMNKRYLDLNSRVSEGGRSTRTVREACLGLLDDGQGFERDACVTYIALGFETEDGLRQCTAGVCLEAKASLNEENVLGLFIVEGVILRFEEFVHPRRGGFEEKAWQSFLDEQRRKGRTVQTFQRQNNRAFLRHLYSIINANARGTQLDPDRARAAMRQALSFDIQQIKSVTDFVKRFLLDDIPIEIDTFQARYTTWREMQKQIARVEAEIKTVESIRSLSERVLEDQFNARFWTYCMHRAEYDRYSAVMARQQKEVSEMQETLDGTRAYQRRLTESIESARLLLDAVKRQIEGIPALKQIEHAQSEKDRQDAVRKTGNIEAKPIFDALSALGEAGASAAFPSTVFASVVHCARTQLSGVIGVYDATWPKSPKLIASAIETVPQLAEARVHVEGLHQRAASEKARLAHDLENVDRLLKTLRGGGTYMSKETQDFLADMSRMGIPAQSLSEVADIAPAFAQWRSVIESVLGDWVDAVIIEPRFMDRAYAHFDYRRLQQIPRLGKSVRDQQIAQLMQDQKDLQPLLDRARESEMRLLAVVEALRRAETVLVTNRADALRTLLKMEGADVESKRQGELIADLEAELPEGVMEQKREVEATLKAYREEETEERNKEIDLTSKIGQRVGAMNSNTEERKKAAAQAYDTFPALERRMCRHDPAIGLERFARRARALYLKERATRDNPALIRNHFETLLKERRLSQRSAVSRLITSVQDYVLANPDQHPGFEWTQFIERERTPTLYDWISLRHRHLKETVLRNFKEQVDKAVLALVETMVHDFLSRLRANIDAVERTKEDLNRALRGSVFMGEVYQIRQERDQDKETIRYLIDRLDIVAPKATALMQSDLDPNDPDQVKIKELIDMLTFEESEDSAHRRRLHELADYRNYFRFTIDICDPEHGYRRISDLEQRRGKASGGQKFVPFYICLGVAAASAYHNHLGGSKDAPSQSALLLMDEAFEKLDPDNIYKVIQFYERLGLQLIMAAPKTHQALYQETFDTLISIIRIGRAVQATAQHFHPAAHELLHEENPMHKPRSYFEERVRWAGKDAAE